MIYTTVKNTIEKNRLIENGDKVLVCVSGGPDSITLLNLMIKLQKDYNIKLVVAHLDHMLRGRQSEADAEFVRRVINKLKIPLIMDKVDVKAFSNLIRTSIEIAAREARYNFYQKAAEKTGANKIATAHTIDDQAETVLMRLLKGAGSLGLSGIPYKRRLGNAWVIRPLLDVKRVDIEKYLKRHRIRSRLDSSNLKTFYLRNRLRHILIPLLEKDFNPRIKENLNLISRSLNDEFNYLNTAANRAFKQCASETKKAITINVNALLRKHIALQRLIVRNTIHILKGDLKRINFKHWEEIESLLRSGKKTIVKLPDGLKVIKKQKQLIFIKGDWAQKEITKFKKVEKLYVPGKIIIPQLGVEIHADAVKAAPKFKKGKKRKRLEYISGDFIEGPLKIRTRRRGDRMRPLGMRSYKKLHDIFIDEKVPRETRDKIPLIVSKKRILWAAGVKPSEAGKISKDTKKIIRLSIASIKHK
jgi:tRNA(Ile)-lysidine synthase